ncbi:MAG: ACP S-malonyltransferase [Clostridium sp.]|nr:ACP S-malonyltransferase [Clostridium sp.]MDY3827288.1 ACP S-malonyltransferase [Clostridium sp.]
MNKLAFVFPGQGAQYVNMAREFYEEFEESKMIFEKAQKVLDFDLIDLCFNENTRINETEYTQAAMVTAEVAILEHIKTLGVKPDVTAGLSLGEYTSLVACGAIDFEDAVKLVRIRGKLMQDSVPLGVGAMAAVMGMTADKIEEICALSNGKVSIANYNSPAQIVITGEAKALSDISEKLIENGAKKVVPLKVSGPFHSSLLIGAGEELYKHLVNVEITKPKYPYVSNVTADYVEDEKVIADLLKKQISSSVRWQQSVERMIENGVDTFIEIGPGKTLSSLIRRIDKNVKCINIEKVEDLSKLSEVIGC